MVYHVTLLCTILNNGVGNLQQFCSFVCRKLITSTRHQAKWKNGKSKKITGWKGKQEMTAGIMGQENFLNNMQLFVGLVHFQNPLADVYKIGASFDAHC